MLRYSLIKHIFCMLKYPVLIQPFFVNPLQICTGFAESYALHDVKNTTHKSVCNKPEKAEKQKEAESCWS